MSMTWRKMVLIGTAVAATAVFLIELPELVRYIKMETM